MEYRQLRNLYYTGIFVLVIYALQEIPMIDQYIIPILDFNLIRGIPIISVIAIAIGIMAFLGFKFRKIG